MSGSFVIVVVDDDGTRRYFTGLRDVAGERYLPTYPLDPHVLRYTTRQSAATDVAPLRAERRVVLVADIFYERPQHADVRAPEGARA